MIIKRKWILISLSLTLSVATAHYPEFTCNQPKTMMIKLMRKLWIFLFGAIQKKNQLKMLDDDTKKKLHFDFHFDFFFRKKFLFLCRCQLQGNFKWKKNIDRQKSIWFIRVNFPGKFSFFSLVMFSKTFFFFWLLFFFMSVHFVFENWFFLFFFVFMFSFSLSHSLISCSFQSID